MSSVRYGAAARIIVAAMLFGLISPFFFGAIISGSVAQAADGEAEEAASAILPLRLSLPAQVFKERSGGNADHGVLRIVGVPPSCSLNRGFLTAGAWFVSLDDVKNLALLAPKNFKGSLVLTVNLIQAPDREPVSWEVPLKISAGSSASQRPVAAEKPIAKKEDIAPPLVPATPSQNDRLQLERARKLLEDNDVASARLVLKRLARANIADAAFELAQTYDPDILQTVQTSGHAVDLKKARKWYMRAAQLGHPKATKRASELQGQRSPAVR
jgi:TPR repeat protein